MSANGFIENKLLDHWDRVLAKKKLDEFYSQILDSVDATIKWYWDQKRDNRTKANWIRGIATTILLFCTLVPYVANYIKDPNFLYIGYLCAGIGGGLLLLDKYKGYSSSWVRFVLLGQQLQTLRNIFVTNWQTVYLKYSPLTPDGFAQLMSTLEAFQTAFNDAIKSETEAWAKEFQDNLGQLLSAIQNQSAAIKTQIEEQRKNPASSNNLPNPGHSDLSALMAAADKFKQDMIKVPNVSTVSLNTDNTVPQIEVHVSKNFDDNSLVPTKLFYVGSNNQNAAVLVNIIRDFDPVVHAQLWPANSILNKSPYPDNRGSVGGKVYDFSTNEPYFLSCYHVVKSPQHDWNFSPVGNESILEFTTGNLCGQIVKAIRDDQIDAAIMRAVDDYQIMDGINGIGVPHFTRDINSDDKKYKTGVKMFGGLTQQLVGGYVMDINVPANILYFKDDHSNNTEYHRLENLIYIKSNDPTPFSQGGDSGSMVIDEYNYLIGILLGGQGNISFVIPFSTIATRLNLKINPS